MLVPPPGSSPALPTGDDLAKTVNLFFEKKTLMINWRPRLREMRPKNVPRWSNRTIFKLNCGDVSRAHSTDIKLQHAEQNVVKSTYPIMRAAEELKLLRQPALKLAIDKLVDGIILLTDTVQDMEQSRHNLYKTVLHEGWKGLLAKPEESHNEMFGNIEARLQDYQAPRTGGGGKGKGDKEVRREVKTL